MKERWEVLVYHGGVFSDNYEVSTRGRIRNKVTGVVLKTHINRKGYEQVCIARGRNKKIVVKVHRAVAETFLGAPEPDQVVNHKDGVKTNNSVENLEWCTKSANTQHAWDNGLFPERQCLGVNNGNAKLNEAAVEFIRANYIPRDKEFGSRALARRFGVDHMTVSCVVRGLTWSK